MTINGWLEVFKQGWVDHDVSSVMEMFADDVEYWETPFQQVPDKSALQSEWEGVTEQDDIGLDTNVVSQDGNTYTVLWHLNYSKQGEEHAWAGTYIIRLNADGLCKYFHQTGERG